MVRRTPDSEIRHDGHGTILPMEREPKGVDWRHWAAAYVLTAIVLSAVGYALGYSIAWLLDGTRAL